MMIWGGDHDYDDYGVEEEGIVSNFSCPNDSCETTALVYHTITKDDE